MVYYDKLKQLFTDGKHLLFGYFCTLSKGCFSMLLEDLAQEFIFSCQCRKLSEKTIHNYRLQLGYLLDYLSKEHGITKLEEVKPQMIKQYLMSMQKKGRKPQYINDLLKVFKCFFRYVFEENYTDELITERIKNVKEPKVIIKTFTNDEVSRMVNYYSGHDYLSVRNRCIMATLFV